MGTGSTNGTVIFDRDDHPQGGKVVLVEHNDGNISVFLYGEEGQIWGRLRFLLEYIRYRDNIDFEVEYSKALDGFFHEYYTEAEWALVALENL